MRSFIRHHGHLPSLPFAPTGSGRNEGSTRPEFAMKLLQKVAELTLHLITQEDLIQPQQRRIDQVEECMRR